MPASQPRRKITRNIFQTRSKIQSLGSRDAFCLIGAALMTKFPAIALLLFTACVCRAKEESTPEFIQGIDQVIPGGPVGNVGYSFATDTFTGTNIFIQHGDTTLIADQATYNHKTGDVV